MTGTGVGAGEGYVRFRMALDQGPAPVHPLLEALNEARGRLYSLGLIGMNAEGIGFGNLSVRVGGTHRFVISGTATGGKPVLGPEDYCQVTDCDIAGNTVRCTGKIRASAESMTHAAVYQANPRIACVIHVHSTRLWRFMLDGEYPRTPEEAEYGTPAIAEAVRRVVGSGAGDEGVVVMAGHADGVLAYGPDIAAPERLLSRLMARMQDDGIGG